MSKLPRIITHFNPQDARHSLESVLQVIEIWCGANNSGLNRLGYTVTWDRNNDPLNAYHFSIGYKGIPPIADKFASTLRVAAVLATIAANTALEEHDS